VTFENSSPTAPALPSHPTTAAGKLKSSGGAGSGVTSGVGDGVGWESLSGARARVERGEGGGVVRIKGVVSCARKLHKDDMSIEVEVCVVEWGVGGLSVGGLFGGVWGVNAVMTAMHTYLYTYIYTCKYAYIHTCIQSCMQTCCS